MSCRCSPEHRPANPIWIEKAKRSMTATNSSCYHVQLSLFVLSEKVWHHDAAPRHDQGHFLYSCTPQRKVRDNVPIRLRRRGTVVVPQPWLRYLRYGFQTAQAELMAKYLMHALACIDPITPLPYLNQSINHIAWRGNDNPGFLTRSCKVFVLIPYLTQGQTLGYEHCCC